MTTTPTAAQPAPRRRLHCLGAYLRELPENLRQVRSDLRDARLSAAPLWPFVWRATMDDLASRCGTAPRRVSTRDGVWTRPVTPLFVTGLVQTGAPRAA